MLSVSGVRVVAAVVAFVAGVRVEVGAPRVNNDNVGPFC
jgi:hypothetical protein